MRIWRVRTSEPTILDRFVEMMGIWEGVDGITKRAGERDPAKRQAGYTENLDRASNPPPTHTDLQKRIPQK